MIMKAGPRYVTWIFWSLNLTFKPPHLLISCHYDFGPERFIARGVSQDLQGERIFQYPDLGARYTSSAGSGQSLRWPKCDDSKCNQEEMNLS